jgi:UDP-glucose 4-epimerase
MENQFSGKIVLITGASGFIGLHLAKRLLKMGAIVHGTSRSHRDSEEENMIWWKASFEDYATAEMLMEEIKPQIIFHLAGTVTASNDIEYVMPTLHSLLTSSVNLLTLAEKQGCERIVLTGSCTEPLDGHPYPNSPYAAAKWATNAYGHLFQRIYKTPVVIVRPFMGYGQTQPAGKLLPSVIQSLLRGESPKLTNGRWVTDWVYIDDTVDGMLAASVAPDVEGKTIDLGTGVLTSVREVIEKVVEIVQPVGKPLFGALPDRHEEHTRIADTKYAFEKIGWKAKISLEEGLRKSVDYYQKVLLYATYEFSAILTEGTFALENI